MSVRVVSYFYERCRCQGLSTLRVTAFFLLIERTSIEAAEQPSAQERGPRRRRPEPPTITHRSRGARRSPTRAGGFVFAEPMAPAPLLSVPVAMPRTPETHS